ncbi:NAD+ synthase [candidate division TA06 bacterium]|uniref:Glutamine-dependent NAD(+) synthetase n=1 Tax=candidate division TA06 bacterium TaxID=2250710 RepID=A0A660S9L4_UNCT6|nr:MAG: NAD+ synthase [candidate division TA06 bacterium]
MDNIRVAIAQINTIVGDIKGNSKKIKRNIKKAHDNHADIVVFPELTITGYPPEDLLYRHDFIEENLTALNKIAKYSKGKDILVILGFVDLDTDIYNAAASIYNGQIINIYHKIFLPNYGVFDEKRYFQSGKRLSIINYKGIKLGITICEDIWYPGGPAYYETIIKNAELIVNISASPYTIGKDSKRQEMIKTRCRDNVTTVVYCNLVGGQDELVFDGNSMIVNEEGNIIAKLSSFSEELGIGDLNVKDTLKKRLKDIRIRELRASEIATPYSFVSYDIKATSSIGKKKNKMNFLIKRQYTNTEEEVFDALVCGTRDYVKKNGFKKVIIAISGGIDSALVSVIASKAIGAGNITGLFLPSQFTASESERDATMLAKNLGIELIKLPIKPLYDSYMDILKNIFKGTKFGVAEENLQARIRGNIVMALSNKFGWLVLTTGNKSEMSVGYATLYGDMAGGFAVIKDVPKTMVYNISEWINKKWHLIPENILLRPPTAELRPNQKDTDSLPEYGILDPILKMYIEQDYSISDIINSGFKENEVKRVARMVRKNEYKRRQSPIGIKITERSFGKDRRYPITNGF